MTATIKQRRRRRKQRRKATAAVVRTAVARARAMPPLLPAHKPSPLESLLSKPGGMEMGLGALGMIFGSMLGGKEGTAISALAFGFAAHGVQKMAAEMAKNAPKPEPDPLVLEAEKALAHHWGKP